MENKQIIVKDDMGRFLSVRTTDRDDLWRYQEVKRTEKGWQYKEKSKWMYAMAISKSRCEIVETNNE